MEYLRCTKTGTYFTKGRSYPILDYMEGGGFVVSDDDNKDHYLSGQYWPDHFEMEDSK